MTALRKQTARIRRFILENVAKRPGDIVRHTAETFGISRQAVGKHISRLVAEHALVQEGRTRSRTYRLHPLVEWTHGYPLTSGLAEDVVWRNDVSPLLKPMPDNALGIWNFCFSEMLNNAIDHSEGTRVTVSMRKTAEATDLTIHDDGVGIFRKIQEALGLLDQRHAVLELAKGKLTTDPEHHPGQGIFFSSRMFDAFQILSGTTSFSHELRNEEDWILESDGPMQGTVVSMRLDNHTARTAKQVLDGFSLGEDYAFDKTVVPVRLARYGNELLVSRSQAKRLLARVDRFRTVVFDFSAVSAIGQAFADEIFRVFAREHLEVELLVIHASEDVRQMISRARAGGAE